MTLGEISKKMRAIIITLNIITINIITINIITRYVVCCMLYGLLEIGITGGRAIVHVISGHVTSCRVTSCPVISLNALPPVVNFSVNL